jgi:L-iditol 2-dehydrogenase
MTTCRAPVFVGPNLPLEIREFDLPTLKEGEILVKMRLAGICGTDVHVWQNPKSPSPVIFGHENVGQIVSGAEIRKFDSVGQEIKNGDLVLFDGKAPCGSCHTCVVARAPTLCERGVHYGFGVISEPPYLRGGYGEYVHLVPTAGLVKASESVPPERCMLAMIGVHANVSGFERMGGIRPGDTVVVQGSGPIGLGAVVVSRMSGAGRIVCIGAPRFRLEVAKELGADEIIDLDEARTQEERVRRVRELTSARGADVVVEASGAASAVDEGIRMTAIGGKYLVLGQATDSGTQPINPYFITHGQLSVFGSWASEPRHWLKAMRIVSEGKVPTGKLITHRFSMRNATEGLRTVSRLESVIAVIQHDPG